MRRAIRISIVIGLFSLMASACLGASTTNEFDRSSIPGASAFYDATVLEGAPDTNYGGLVAWMRVSRSHVDYANEAAALLKFDVSALPVDFVIDKVVLRVHKYQYFGHQDDSNSNGTIQVDCAPLLQSWDGAEVTFNSNTATTAWNEPCARAIAPSLIYDGVYDRGPVADSVVVSNSTVDGLDTEAFLHWDVTDSFEDQLANDKHYGWILHGDMPNPGDVDGFTGLRDSTLAPATYPWPTLLIIGETVDLAVEGSDDPNWTTDNLADLDRTATVPSTSGAEFRVRFGD